ncbi:MAG: type II secretion system GspH family protein [Proteobacteria bacterium]|nr:type II secretion system GspH family protein [Pseudomonadota bacterium]
MRDRCGFTLIELVIVIAIISILSGIMVPLVFKYWDTENREITKERMNLLKMAMVGDSRLVQSGVRTSFGYVGEYGQLPTDLSELVSFGTLDLHNENYKKDAWGNNFIYTYVYNDSGKISSAKIISTGSDSKLGTSDDLEIVIDEKEVFPTNNVLSKIDIFLNAPPQNTLTYFLKVTAETKSGITSCCKPINILGSSGNNATHYTSDLQCVFDEYLPIGVSVFSLEAYSDNDCRYRIPQQASEQSFVVVGDRIGNITISQKIYIHWEIL